MPIHMPFFVQEDLIEFRKVFILIRYQTLK
jgi:hypothetical protein